MKTFFSLIKISPNELAGDNLTIGIILLGEAGLKSKFSKKNIRISKALLDTNNSIVDFIVKEIENKLSELNDSKKINNTDLFEFPSLLSADYFSYLSKYSNGLLKFTEPNFISGSIDEDKFTKLYALYVDSSTDSTDKPPSSKEYEHKFSEKINSKLISRIKNKVHINYSFDKNIIPSLYNPFSMDCIGLNGTLIGAKALPFIHSRETLHKSINTYCSVIAQLSSKFKQSLDTNNFFLISDKPVKKNSSEYDLWNHLRKEEALFKVISSDESEQVAELIESKGAKVFLDQ